MHLSVFDLFKVGIGPSSSHTVGPMKAALYFIHRLKEYQLIDKTARIKVELFGSLALTGIGHGSDKAILLGLEGEDPSTINPDLIESKLKHIRTCKELNLSGVKRICFNEIQDLIFQMEKRLDFHTNGMQFSAYDKEHDLIREDRYYSIGGGFVLHEQDRFKKEALYSKSKSNIPYPFSTGNDLLKLGKENDLSIAEIMMANELCFRSESEIKHLLHNLWDTMHSCIQRGIKIEGVLPGGLFVKRRAPKIFKKLIEEKKANLNSNDPLIMMDWVNLWAMSVNEENASGGRVVTAPTNGAAGIIPAVLKYFTVLKKDNLKKKDIETFLLTAAAIGALYKKNASISGAEAGCQGEVGVACSMAAAGLAAVKGGSNEQIENAAEIGMEHNLGLTCDPIKGLVQIPCIERNAIGSIKAIDAARIALYNNGDHKVSLDDVIKTMYQTGLDMAEKYKETSKGGLAVNVNIIEC